MASNFEQARNMLFDAVRKELGLKLEKVQRPEPVLVIDHVDEQPTPN